MESVYDFLNRNYIPNTTSTVCSGVLTKPVSWDLVGLEGFFSELSVASVLDSVDLKSVRVAVDVMVLCEHVRYWVHSCNCCHSEVQHNLSVLNLVSGYERQKL